ncbi:kinase-like domain-containing protein [Rhizoctonia solani]|nr:kinase-like domain-containing protein [Rhizoctonia solani]
MKKIFGFLNKYTRDERHQRRGLNAQQPVPLAATSPIVITHTTPIEEILSQFVMRGCVDLTGDLENCQVGRLPVLGGGFGDIYCGTFPDGQQVALKCLRIHFGVSDTEKRHLRRAAQELHVWSKCQHPNILRLMGVANHDGRIAMVSPWMENGHVRDFLSRRPEVNRCALCTQISEAVVYLHEKNIVHGDIKGTNILVSKDCIPKLTDFGSANIKGTTLQLVGHSSKTNPGMSVRWAAPEILQGTAQQTVEGDVYALGMTILEIITCSLPYTGLRDVAVFNRVIHRIPPERPVEYIPPGHQHTDYLWSLLANSWKSNPADRPMASEFRNKLLRIAQIEVENPVLREALNSLGLGESTTVSTARIQPLASNLEVINGIGSKMPLEEILLRLVEHGCKDLTPSLDLSESSELPLSSSDFRDIYRGTLQDGSYIQLEALRFRAGLGGDGRKLLKHTAHEIYVRSKCKHANVLQLIGVAQYHGHLMMVSPWVEHKDLIGFLLQQRYDVIDRLGVCAQVADAVAYLHDANIVHGDIKALNVTLSHDRRVKLTGFGNMALRNYTLAFTPTTHGLGLAVRWAAPEIVEGKTQLSSEADIYALGMTILEIITGSVPYARLRDVAVFNKVTNKIHPDRPLEQLPIGNEFANPIWSLLTSCWNYDPVARPNAITVHTEIVGATYAWYQAPASPDGGSESEHEPAPQALDSTEGENIPIERVMEHLVNHGCRDMTDQLEISGVTIVGMNNYGRVDCARLLDGSQVQIRRFNLKFGRLGTDLRALKRAATELSKWSKCRHPHVLAFTGIVRYHGEVAIISPWMKNGQLDDFLVKNKLKWMDRFTLARQVADAVSYLHDQKIVHGDIQASNILVSDDHMIVLTGFEGEALEDMSLTQSTGETVSTRWAAPELILGTVRRSTQSDVYALGMTILEIITGKAPYHGMTNIAAMMKVLRRIPPQRAEEHFPSMYQEADVLWSLLVRCWHYDPFSRPVTKEVLEELQMIPPRDQWVKYH